MEAKVGLEVEKNKKITALLIDPKSQQYPLLVCNLYESKLSFTQDIYQTKFV
jgi:hypothetical protein